MLESISLKSVRSEERSLAANYRGRKPSDLLRYVKPNETQKSKSSLENQSKLANLMFSPEDSDLTQVRWHLHKAGYAMHSRQIKNSRFNVYAHRIVMQRMIGRALLNSEIVDHISHETLDNRRENL